MWLKTARAEEKQLYHEVQLIWREKRKDSDAGTDNIGPLADMLIAKYMTRRTGPEVVDLLNGRRQMRGETPARSLREIAEQGDIGEDWLVNAFLKEMGSLTGATHVREHRHQPLDEAVNLAIPHVGDYGEGYGIGLEAAMTA
ncbi:hypothetical protein PHMEG_0007838 [Phytophthora megakarya]|uniref:Uncharacterized protein n=1 Tax=Phytophthora megakarya TaxID=4795 RepID=A0A225WK89_9STRA|nr:hypothetical protein PHMEG_0007838 [Phytophthora megakarya]